MKASLGFDPFEHDYGPATFAVRRILGAFTDIDWFEPPPEPARALRPGEAFALPYRAAPEFSRSSDPGSAGIRCFEEHLTLAHCAAPSLVPVAARVESLAGGWASFASLRERIAKQSWDWKSSCLKAMTHAHCEARAWSVKALAREATPNDPPAPGSLFFRFGDAVIWTFAPRADFSSLAPERRELADWYFYHAALDALEAIQWQMADGCEELDSNPFVPLLAAYRAGLHPFGLAPDHYVGVTFAP